MSLRLPLSILTLCGAAAATLVPAPAGAAEKPKYTGPEVCGKNYYLMGHSEIRDYDSTTMASVRAYESGGGKQMCAVTIKYENVGIETITDVEASFEDQPRSRAHADLGAYKYYAGPVYISLQKGCIDLYGEARGTQNYRATTSFRIC